MYRPFIITFSKNQTTMSTGIIGIILDDLAVFYDRSHFGCCYHTVRSRHLPNSMRKIKIFFLPGKSN